MNSLYWQTALLMAGAYFLGALVSCLLRKLFASSQPQPYKRIAVAGGAGEPAVDAPPETPVEERPRQSEQVVAPGQAAEMGHRDGSASLTRDMAVSERAQRFERSLSGEGIALKEAAPIAEAEAEPAAPEPVVGTSDVTADQAGGAGIAATVAATAAAAVIATNKSPSEPEVVAAPPPAAEPVTPAVTVPVQAPTPAVTTDDLQNIRNIDFSIEQELKKNGITRYDQIASWNGDDVSRVNNLLGASGRVQKENWIEQATVLSTGGQTVFSRLRRSSRQGQANAALAPYPQASAIAAEPVSASVTAPGPASEPEPVELADNVQLAGSSSAATSSQKTAGDSATSTSVAAAAAASAAAVAALTGQRNRQPEKGGAEAPTAPSTPAAPTQSAAAAPPPVASSVAEPVVSRPQDAADQAARVDRLSSTTEPRPERVPREPREERAPRDSRPERELREPREPREERDAGQPRRSLQGMRSVRSQAYQDADQGQIPSTTARVVSSEVDDLKRVRGIGVLIERRLNGLGITRYEQIANWSADDVARISQALDFKGRIERENWVEQARILATGGYTEFSSRVDRGEVDSSRKKS